MGRELNPKLLDWAKKRLAGNATAQNAIERKDPRALLIQVEFCFIGQKEVGKNRGEIIDLVQDVLGDIGDDDAYCARGQNACIAIVEHILGVQSPIYPSGSCWRLFEKTPKKQRVKWEPLPGALVVWQRGTGLTIGNGGHVGMVVSYDHKAKTFEAIEFNTGDGIDPVTKKDDGFGQGVHYTKRKDIRHKFDGTVSKDLKILGFLKPF